MKFNVKQYLIKMLLFIVILAPFAIIACLCWQPKDKNYKIVGISLRPIEIVDTTAQFRQYFLLHFTVEFCNPSYGFLAGGTEPGLNGSIEKLASFRIFDINNKDITKEIKGWHTSIPNIVIDSKGDDHHYYSHDNIDSLVNDINANVRSTRGCRIRDERIFYIEDSTISPSSIHIAFESYAITEHLSTYPYEKKDTLKMIK